MSNRNLSSWTSGWWVSHHDFVRGGRCLELAALHVGIGCVVHSTPKLSQLWKPKAKQLHF